MTRLSLVVPAFAAIALAACSKPESGGSTSAASASPSLGSAATTTTTATATAPPTAPAYVQKGIGAGKVIVGYIADPTDPSQCIVATDTPDKKAQFAKDGDKLAAMFKGKVAPSCPTDKVVGTCDAHFGVLLNYYGPKWTADTAKPDCAKQKGTWVP